MEQVILIIHGVMAILLTIAILAQEKGAGIGSALAGAGGTGFYATKRGAAKVLHYASIVFAVFFVASSIAIILT